MIDNSQICTTIEQSERLLALGLKKETADMVYRSFGYIIDEFGNKERRFKQPTMVVEGWESKYDIPAWSLHRLWELLPKSIWHDNGLEKKYHPIIEYGFVNYVAECGMELFDFDCGYDVWRSMIVVIEWLIKEGYFPKEYLVNQTEIEEHCKGVLEYLDYIRGEEE